MEPSIDANMIVEDQEDVERPYELSECSDIGSAGDLTQSGAFGPSDFPQALVHTSRPWVTVSVLECIDVPRSISPWLLALEQTILRTCCPEA